MACEYYISISRGILSCSCSTTFSNWHLFTPYSLKAPWLSFYLNNYIQGQSHLPKSLMSLTRPLLRHLEYQNVLSSLFACLAHSRTLGSSIKTWMKMTKPRSRMSYGRRSLRRWRKRERSGWSLLRSSRVTLAQYVGLDITRSIDYWCWNRRIESRAYRVNKSIAEGCRA
jgi:hypothetical protein